MKQRQGPTWADTMWRNGRNVLSLEKKFTWLVKRFRYRLDGMKELCRVRTTHSRKDGKYRILRRIERGADVVPGYTSEKYNIFLILPFTFLTVITFLGEVKVLKSETWKIILSDSMWYKCSSAKTLETGTVLYHQTIWMWLLKRLVKQNERDNFYFT